MKKKTKEEMDLERQYTKEVVDFLFKEYQRVPRFTDRFTHHYRLKIGTDYMDAYYKIHPQYGFPDKKSSKQVCEEIAATFPGVIALKAGIHIVGDVDEQWWCIKVPFVKPDTPAITQLEIDFDNDKI